MRGLKLNHTKYIYIYIAMSNLDAKIRDGREGDLVGDFGLGDRNEREIRWLEWCKV